MPEWRESGCLTVTEENIDGCSFGPADASGVIAVLGDSTAISDVPMLREAFPDKRIQVLTRGECPAASIEALRISGSAFPECDAQREWAENWVSAHAPEMVVVTDVSTTIGRMAKGTDLDANIAEYGRGLAATVSRLASATGRVVVLHSPPLSENVEKCKSPVLGPSACVAHVDTVYERWDEAVSEAATDQRWKNVTDVPVIDWYCTERLCPAFIGKVRVYAGGAHLTAPAGRASADLLLNALSVG